MEEKPSAQCNLVDPVEISGRLDLNLVDTVTAVPSMEVPLDKPWIRINTVTQNNWRKSPSEEALMSGFIL